VKKSKSKVDLWDAKSESVDGVEVVRAKLGKEVLDIYHVELNLKLSVMMMRIGDFRFVENVKGLICPVQHCILLYHLAKHLNRSKPQ